MADAIGWCKATKCVNLRCVLSPIQVSASQQHAMALARREAEMSFVADFPPHFHAGLLGVSWLTPLGDAKPRNVLILVVFCLRYRLVPHGRM